ncbi:MAG: isochorismatase family protein [Clostridiales Family XIII bacterium]|jgi:isochorismate hydrolase|nr:isochorismatase family protein [Clostridiales Family XIII bacterium]
MTQNSSTLRLNKTGAVLVVVDMQEKLVPAMDNRESLVAACEKLVKGCAILGVPAIFTQQYTKGLGATIPEIENAWRDGTQDGTQEDGSTVHFPAVDKMSFSVGREKAFLEELSKVRAKKKIILCGIESHVCVLQSALDFRIAGFSVFLAADAAASRHDRDYTTALRRLERAGVVVTTTESILFELLGDAKHPKFKEISNLVK